MLPPSNSSEEVVDTPKTAVITTVASGESSESTALNQAQNQDDPNEALNKSYDSMPSDEKEEPHYNIESDGEPPTDEPGDKVTIITKRQVVKEIMRVGADLGKPGRPFICTVSVLGYFAKPESEQERQIKKQKHKMKYERDGPVEKDKKEVGGKPKAKGPVAATK